MGLDTTHDAFHGSYGSFDKMRYWLASQINIDLDEYYGYGPGEKKIESIQHEIMPLLNHSDCDGQLSPDECKKIASGIKKILDEVPYDDSPYSNYQMSLRFMHGCLAASKKIETILFN